MVTQTIATSYGLYIEYVANYPLQSMSNKSQRKFKLKAAYVRGKQNSSGNADTKQFVFWETQASKPINSLLLHKKLATQNTIH